MVPLFCHLKGFHLKCIHYLIREYPWPFLPKCYKQIRFLFSVNMWAHKKVIQEVPTICVWKASSYDPFCPHHSEFWLWSFTVDSEQCKPSDAGWAIALIVWQHTEMWGHPNTHYLLLYKRQKRWSRKKVKEKKLNLGHQSYQASLASSLHTHHCFAQAASKVPEVHGRDRYRFRNTTALSRF